MHTCTRTQARRHARMRARAHARFLQRTAVERTPIVVTMAADWPWQGREFAPPIDGPTMQ
eukprot:5105701-Alexandrium_andersonii.AAC.1